MKHLAEFVSEHISDDISRLILNRDKWPETDMEMAVNCIESRRKLRNKIPEWDGIPELIFPAKLSAEQCSSSATGLFKAELAEKIAGYDTRSKKGWKIADLTGGLGADTWFFSKKAEKVLYNEMQEILCKAAGHNFQVLGSDNIVISNAAISSSNAEAVLKDFHPDIIYLDPARRAESGRKVFLLEDCSPDILKLKETLFRFSRHIMVKLSPMADITMVCDRLGSCCREVYVIASEGECKELLVWMDREWEREYTITAVELHGNNPAGVFTFTPSEEKNAVPEYVSGLKGKAGHGNDVFLFEPGKSLMKAGGFNILGKRYGIGKIGKSTHYYIISEPSSIADLKALGKIYKVIDCAPLDKRNIRNFGTGYPKADVTARNLPMDTETLRKKLGVISGDDTHIFGLKSDVEGNLLLCTQRVFQQYLQADGYQDEASGKLSL